ncbi:type II secretion system protein [Rossellomorea sp. y25]|uniref:type II secretion system protein n=1 Tax=Rossellomorea sp. y25 TaxID=3118174 RepID=UPI00260EC549|nr:type II secretion system protein [uncultured Rossellomorea sp.]
MLKKMRKMLKNERGLTLVELLAVIVILGIIAAIAVPSIGSIINKSKDDAVVAEAIQIISAAKLAHASDSEAKSWDEVSLSSYLSNVDDAEFDVVYENNVYKIKGHPAQSIVTGAVATELTEKELTEAAK